MATRLHKALMAFVKATELKASVEETQSQHQSPPPLKGSLKRTATQLGSINTVTSGTGEDWTNRLHALML